MLYQNEKAAKAVDSLSLSNGINVSVIPSSAPSPSIDQDKPANTIPSKTWMVVEFVISFIILSLGVTIALLTIQMPPFLSYTAECVVIVGVPILNIIGTGLDLGALTNGNDKKTPLFVSYMIMRIICIIGFLVLVVLTSCELEGVVHFDYFDVLPEFILRCLMLLGALFIFILNIISVTFCCRNVSIRTAPPTTIYLQATVNGPSQAINIPPGSQVFFLTTPSMVEISDKIVSETA